MVELHSFYIFFKKKSIYRGLYTDAAKRAVKNCVAKTDYYSKGFKVNNDPSSEGFNSSETLNLDSSRSEEFYQNSFQLTDPDLEFQPPSVPSFDQNLRCHPSTDGSRTKDSDGGGRSRTRDHNLYHNMEDNQHLNYEKLLLGFLSGLTSFSKTICETNDLKAPEGLSVSHFNVCTTHFFKIHYFETITGYKLVCLTSNDVPNLGETLKSIYVDILNNLILSNPTYVVGTVISSSEFDSLLRKTILSSM